MAEASAEEKAQRPIDVRVAVIGNVDSGKSTMIGVLTSGDLDDGRGSARMKILRHNHERSNGRTSCSSQHIVGFNDAEPVHQAVPISATPKQKTTAWTAVFKNSRNIVTFIDLAGHERYLKTTISGLTGCFPDYAFIVVGANMGISRMTKEHICVAVALEIPLFVVVTKVDICPERVLKHTLKQLSKLLKGSSCGKLPMMIKEQEAVDTCFANDPQLQRVCPVFLVSAVTGEGMQRLNYFLSRLTPRQPWRHEGTDVAGSGELEIDETFAVKGVGMVVSGTVTGGRIHGNQKLFIGPFSDGSFKEVLTKTVQMKRVPVEVAVAGDACSVAFRFAKRKEVVDRKMIRKGMVAVSEHMRPRPVWGFQANVLVLHHPTMIKSGYQPVVHCANIRQTASVMKMSQATLRSGDGALVEFKWLRHPEFMHEGRPLIIREGSTKCIGKVTRLYEQYDPAASDLVKDLADLKAREMAQARRAAEVRLELGAGSPDGEPKARKKHKHKRKHKHKHRDKDKEQDKENVGTDLDKEKERKRKKKKKKDKEKEKDKKKRKKKKKEKHGHSEEASSEPPMESAASTPERRRADHDDGATAT